MTVTVSDNQLDPPDIAIMALIAGLNADSGLHAIHGGNNTDDLRVWREFPDATVSSPLITIDVEERGQQQGFMGVDLFRPRLQVDCFAEDQHVAGAMLKYIRDNWTIPEQRAVLDSTGFRISLFSGETSFGPIRVKRTSNQVELKQVPSLWNVRIAPIP